MYMDAASMYYPCWVCFCFLAIAPANLCLYYEDECLLATIVFSQLRASRKESGHTAFTSRNSV